MTYTPPTWPFSAVKRNECLANLRTKLLAIKNVRKMTCRQIGDEAGVTEVQVSNASGWSATYPVYNKLIAWCELNEGRSHD